jgi:nucleoid DNA-binding protein
MNGNNGMKPRKPGARAEASVTKRDLVVRIANETGLQQEAVHDVIQRLLDHITEALKQGQHIEFRDFGVFQVIVRKARVGRNPTQPQNVVPIPARRVVKFKPGRLMKLTMPPPA